MTIDNKFWRKTKKKKKKHKANTAANLLTSTGRTTDQNDKEKTITLEDRGDPPAPSSTEKTAKNSIVLVAKETNSGSGTENNSGTATAASHSSIGKNKRTNAPTGYPLLDTILALLPSLSLFQGAGHDAAKEIANELKFTGEIAAREMAKELQPSARAMGLDAAVVVCETIVRVVRFIFYGAVFLVWFSCILFFLIGAVYVCFWPPVQIAWHVACCIPLATAMILLFLGLFLGLHRPLYCLEKESASISSYPSHNRCLKPSTTQMQG